MYSIVRHLRLEVLLAATAIIATHPAGAAPTVTGISGTVEQGAQIIISGASFGVKSPAQPYLWAPMDGSANPSPLGIVKSWHSITQLTYKDGCGDGGGGCLEGAPSDGVTTNKWAASILAPAGNDWNAYGRKTYVFRKYKRSFTYDSSKNVKIFRFWDASATSSLAPPDFYFATSNGRIGVEGIPNPYSDYTMDQTTLTKAKGPVNTWNTQELWFKSNSSTDAADADFRLAVNGGPDLVSFPNTTWMTNAFKLKTDSGYANDGRMIVFFPIHMVVEGSDGWVPTPAGSEFWTDDIYVDNTWARVMIGDASTLTACTDREIQIPFKWSTGSIGVYVNIKAFPPGTPMYLFVVDADGVASTGYPIGTSPAGKTAAVRPDPPTTLAVQ